MRKMLTVNDLKMENVRTMSAEDEQSLFEKIRKADMTKVDDITVEITVLKSLLLDVATLSPAKSESAAPVVTDDVPGNGFNQDHGTTETDDEDETDEA